MYDLGKNIFDRICFSKYVIENFNDLKNSNAIKHLIKKRNGFLGLGGLALYRRLGVLSDDEYYEILRREPIKQITKISEQSNFVSLKTESGNFYVGNFGLINVQC